MRACSIIVPVYGRPGLTAHCLESLTDDWPRSAFEIVIVDDGSDDETAHALCRIAERDARIVMIRRASNGGFAIACNDGARTARGRYLVFLNNDTKPLPGWLDELVDYAEQHPVAAVVGAKLLYPDLSVQHAGIVFDGEGNPRHAYCGFPRMHPAVNRAGAVQAVTGAAMLVRKETFESLGGFDSVYRNGHEDVDFCLRVNGSGHQVHYSPKSELVHLESATRGRDTTETAANGKRFRSEWSEIVKTDDVERYVADGLLRLSYDHDGFLEVDVDPRLGTAAMAPADELRRRLHDRSNQVVDLLRQLTALTVAEIERSQGSSAPRAALACGRLQPSDSAEEDDELIAALTAVRAALAAREGGGRHRSDCRAAYRQFVRRFRLAIKSCTPPAAEVAVISRGDPALIDLDERHGLHFPADDDGIWLGYHPAGSHEAISLLNRSLEGGVTHLAIPATSMWWLDAYPGLAETLRSEWTRVPTAADCSVFAVAP